MRAVSLALLLFAATPAAFWLLYGTLDPCDAVAQRGLQMLAGQEPIDPLAAGLAALAGPAVIRGMLGDATPQQCLEVLWKLEREPGGRLAPARPAQ